MGLILVTGGSGFVGSHIILQLLRGGYEVRTTVRNLNRESEVRAMLAQGGVEAGDRLSFVAADLERDAGWPEAVAGCAYVLHVASPFSAGKPGHEDDLIVPARDGTLRVLRAARDAGVKRVVVTSSFAAVGYGQPPRTTPFDETNWTDVSGADVQPYMKSKAIAERAAWDFITSEGGDLELSVINPVGIFGPALGPDFSGSLALVQRLMEGAMPGTPRISFGVVDARDLADLHIRAMTDPAAKGERFIAVAGHCMSLHDVAVVLKAHLGTAADKVPLRQLPDWLVRLSAVFNPAARDIVPQLGKVRNATSEKAGRLLGWTPRPPEETLVATAGKPGSAGAAESAVRGMRTF